MEGGPPETTGPIRGRPPHLPKKMYLWAVTFLLANHQS